LAFPSSNLTLSTFSYRWNKTDNKLLECWSISSHFHASLSWQRRWTHQQC